MQPAKRRAYRIFLPLLILCLLFSFAACGKARLPKPTGLNIDAPTLTLTWNPVSDAAYYTVRISGSGGTDEADSGKNSYSLELLPAGDYTLSVKAVVGSGSAYSDSSWSASIRFTRERETGLIFRLIDSNTAYAVSGLGTAQGEIVIPDTYRGLPVTEIAKQAFFNKTTVTKVTLGKNIRTIGEQAFANCSFLTSVTLPDGLCEIGKQAFQSCRALATPIVLPDSLTVLSEQAFEYCRAIPSVTFGSGIEEIGGNAFNGCEKLTALVIPDTVETIGESAFSACTALTSVTIGNGVRTIGTDAFRRCTALPKVTFGQNVESIGDYAFAECTALTAVTLPDSTKTIGEEAFYGCTKLADATLGSGINKISRRAFTNTALWEEKGGTYVSGWFIGSKEASSSESHAVGDAQYLKEGTVGIADAAFENCTGFDTMLTLPDSVQYIGDYAFAGCMDLINVVIGKGVTAIGEHAFESSGIAVIVLGEFTGKGEGERLGESSLVSIGDYAFAECSTLEEIEMPATLRSVGLSAFEDSAIWTQSETLSVYADNWLVGYKDADAFGSVNVSDGTVGIASYAFYRCDNLSGVSVPDSVQYIGRSAFYQCTGLTEVRLSASLTAIEDYTFYQCTNLTLPKLPASLTRIGRSAFYQCKLGSAASDTDSDQLVIPDKVEEIGDYAFYECGFTYEDTSVSASEGENLKNGGIDAVVIGNGTKRIGSRAFAGMNSLKSVILGNGITEIAERAFYKCENLAEVTFGNSIRTVKERAFYGCSSLKEAILPSSLTEIGNYAFYRCAALQTVSLGNAERIGDYAFFGCTSLENAQLPLSLVSIGKQAFRNCAALKSINLQSSVKEIGAHAFYGCNVMTVYTQQTEAPAGWNTRWNSSYRPIVWGCEFAEGGYLVCFEKNEGSISDLNMKNGLTAPYREGYTFGGWSLSANGKADYALADTAQVPSGTLLYAVWTANA